MLAIAFLGNQRLIATEGRSYDGFDDFFCDTLEAIASAALANEFRERFRANPFTRERR